MVRCIFYANTGTASEFDNCTHPAHGVPTCPSTCRECPDRVESVDLLPILCLENARGGGIYQFAGGWMRVNKIYRISEEYARQNDLCYLNRVTVTDCNGVQHNFALTPERR